MILAAHQPCYFPSLSYFAKMARADIFVVADDLQYSTHGNMNRAQIKNAEGTQWLTVPVLTKGLGRQKIENVQIAHELNWQQKHWKTLLVNYKNAAYFEKYVDFFEALYRREWRYLIELNLTGIEFIRNALAIHSPLYRSSTLQIPFHGTRKIVQLCLKLGCCAYLTESENQKYLDESQFKAAGIDLIYFDYRTRKYHQQFKGFLGNLSVIDLLLNEGEDARECLI